MCLHACGCAPAAPRWSSGTATRRPGWSSSARGRAATRTGPGGLSWAGAGNCSTGFWPPSDWAGKRCTSPTSSSAAARQPHPRPAGNRDLYLAVAGAATGGAAPRVILALGNTPTSICWTIRASPGCAASGTGTGSATSFIDAYLMPMFHPAYLLRNDTRAVGGPKSLTWQNIQEVRRRAGRQNARGLGGERLDPGRKAVLTAHVQVAIHSVYLLNWFIY